jgi:hypothetical protein
VSDEVESVGQEGGEFGLPRIELVTSVNVVEKGGVFEVGMVQAALGGSWSVSLVGAGLSISPMASTPM